MPILLAYVSGHKCMLPNADTMVAHGYLAGTEWACEIDGAVWMLATVGGAGPYWAKTGRRVDPQVPVFPSPFPVVVGGIS